MQTLMAERTASRAASMIETVLSARLVTTTVDPSGETRARPGFPPTRSVAATVRWGMGGAETLPDPELATYARRPSGETEMKYGRGQTPMVATTLFRAASV